MELRVPSQPKSAHRDDIVGNLSQAPMAERGSYSRLQQEGAMTLHPSFNPEQFALCYRTYAAALLDIQLRKGQSKPKAARQ
jgi:hypothetical protein